MWGAYEMLVGLKEAIFFFKFPLMFSDAVLQVMVFSTTLWIFSMASL